jgi:hypothetical protein
MVRMAAYIFDADNAKFLHHVLVFAKIHVDGDRDQMMCLGWYSSGLVWLDR